VCWGSTSTAASLARGPTGRSWIIWLAPPIRAKSPLPEIATAGSDAKRSECRADDSHIGLCLKKRQRKRQRRAASGSRAVADQVRVRLAGPWAPRKRGGLIGRPSSDSGASGTRLPLHADRDAVDLLAFALLPVVVTVCDERPASAVCPPQRRSESIRAAQTVDHLRHGNPMASSARSEHEVHAARRVLHAPGRLRRSHSSRTEMTI
jgi:hypothetical protein